MTKAPAIKTGTRLNLQRKKQHKCSSFSRKTFNCYASDEIAEVFVADARHEMAYQRRLSRHKAQYSLDCDDGIEYSACLHEPTPQELLERIVWRPLFSLRYNSKSIWLFHTRK